MMQLYANPGIYVHRIKLPHQDETCMTKQSSNSNDIRTGVQYMVRVRINLWNNKNVLSVFETRDLTLDQDKMHPHHD